MTQQISMYDLFREEKKPAEPVRIPVPKEATETVYTIPQDVFETRCRLCVHKRGAENIPVPLWAVHRPQYAEIIPCRIMAISRPNDKPGECMSFAPRFGLKGICESCRHNNIFHEGFCMKENHAEQHRVYWGTDYGGDARKVDYYGRHRLSVCDDYEPDQYVKEEQP